MLLQKKVQQERELRDIAVKNEREQEDIMLKIRRESQLLAGLGAVPIEDNHITSTPLKTPQDSLPNALTPTDAPIFNVNQQVPITPQQHIQSYLEPRLKVARFDGDPQRWPNDVASIEATLTDTAFAESVKLLSLQESLQENI